MRLLFILLSIIYVAMIFLLADSSAVSHLEGFNPYSLLHIPLYGILAILLSFSFFPIKLNQINQINETDEKDQKNQINFFIVGIIALIVGIADEIHQSYIPTRDASVLDVLLDFTGIALTLFLFSILLKKRAITQCPND
ncbi:MAG: VanZ family protein [Thermodesulfobacteriota bacterium]